MRIDDLFGKGDDGKHRKLDPNELAGAKIIGAESNYVPSIRDFVDERPLSAAGTATHFFVAEGKSFGSPFAVPGVTYERGLRDVCMAAGLTVLVASEDGEEWRPMVGARVVLRLQMDGYQALDCCTRGDGSTVGFQLPLHRAEVFRVEVSGSDRYAGRDARCVIHALTQEKIK